MGEELAFAPVAELARMIASREISPLELTDHFLARADRLNSKCSAFIEVTSDDARGAAAAADATPPQGPLHGIPFASKDLIDVAGVKTTAGSQVLADNCAEADAHVIARLRAAGAISLGKLNLHEFAYGATGENRCYGTPVNAYDRTCLAGGSSSGSAAAVAFGLVPAALGTDTGGSVRAPASLCGLVGLKPTFGRISTRGVVPYSWTLDHVGIISRTVEDAALLLGVIAGHDPLDPNTAREPVPDYVAEIAADKRLDGLTIGVPRRFFFDHADEEILTSTEHVLRHLERMGAIVRDVELPSMEHARTVSLTIQMPEALSFHSRYLEDRGHLYSDDFRAGLALGQCILAEHYIRAKRMVTRYRQEVDETMSSVDLLITPTTPVTAPKIGEVNVAIDGGQEAVGNAITRFTTFFNMSGQPAITVPSGMHSSGLPMGVQLVARNFEESLLLRAASAVNREEKFHVAPPNIG